MSVLSEDLVERAIAGDERAFQRLTEPHRRELEFHCYRMLGSLQDAEDVLQDTLVAAWAAIGKFERRASVRTWLYRIATNRCLNALRDAKRRPPAAPQAPFTPPPPTRVAEPGWLEPCPEDRLGWLEDLTPGPEARYEQREGIELAFVAALQRLTGRQRAALLLHDVLGFRAAEVATMLDSSEDGVKGALRRARAAFDDELAGSRREQHLAAESPQERALVQSFVDAFIEDDVERMVSLLTADAWLSMPPSPLEYQGAAIGTFLSAISQWRAGQPPYALRAQRANGQPAFGAYRVDPGEGVAVSVGLIVLTLTGAGISRITWFVGQQYVQAFGLPASTTIT